MQRQTHLCHQHHMLALQSKMRHSLSLALIRVGICVASIRGTLRALILSAWMNQEVVHADLVGDQGGTDLNAKVGISICC